MGKVAASCWMPLAACHLLDASWERRRQRPQRQSPAAAASSEAGDAAMVMGTAVAMENLGFRSGNDGVLYLVTIGERKDEFGPCMV